MGGCWHTPPWRVRTYVVPTVSRQTAFAANLGNMTFDRACQLAVRRQRYGVHAHCRHLPTTRGLNAAAGGALAPFATRTMTLNRYHSLACWTGMRLDAQRTLLDKFGMTDNGIRTPIAGHPAVEPPTLLNAPVCAAVPSTPTAVSLLCPPQPIP